MAQRSLPVSVTAVCPGQVPGPSLATGDDASVLQQAQEALVEISWVSGAYSAVSPCARVHGCRRDHRGCKSKGAI